MEGTVSGSGLGSVIVGVDGSQSARQAALWAAAEAVRRERPLHVLYAADTDGRALYLSAPTVERIHRAGRALLDDTAAALAQRHRDLSVTTELSRAAPVPSLHRCAGRRGTIVVGNRGLGGFNSLMLGSVGLKTVMGAQTPVVVVRGVDDGAETGADTGAETGAVLAAVRDEQDLAVARHAAREAAVRGASLRMLHVWHVLQSVGSVVSMLDDVEEIAAEHARRLNAVADRIREEFPALSVRAEAEKSVSVAGVLVEASRDADLLVMGGRRSSAGMGPTLGRATHSLLHHSHCPVELLPRNAGTSASAS
ncbi:universal stress protein [Streptomyces sp. NPDC016562]|uniref:universal stress protein n=1 Tax=Streptomyces sp. NPDC016562 TaxID=3364966 RepID=UPI0036FB180F